MPELVEAELTRRALAPLIGRTVTGVRLLDPSYEAAGLGEPDLRAALAGRPLTAITRWGKALLLDFDGVEVRVRFGMTGRAVLGGAAVIGALEYGPPDARPEWDRVRLRLDGGAQLRLNDPRRFGSIALDPPPDRLGPDAMGVRATALGARLAGRRRPLKAALLDRNFVAGVGNLIADETLWQAGLDPRRPAGGLDGAEAARLAATLRRTVRRLVRLGGSHRGALQPHRRSGGRCPRCGTVLARGVVGGRTTYWCPLEQR